MVEIKFQLKRIELTNGEEITISLEDTKLGECNNINPQCVNSVNIRVTEDGIFQMYWRHPVQMLSFDEWLSQE